MRAREKEMYGDLKDKIKIDRLISQATLMKTNGFQNNELRQKFCMDNCSVPMAVRPVT